MEDIPTCSHQEIESEVHVPIEMENINIASQVNERIDDPVVTSIEGMLQSLPALSSERCIYRVPVELREVNLKAYTPQIVSIGPFHHGSISLQAMEEHKLRYLQTFLRRTRGSLEDCVKFVRMREERARCCYEETIKLSSDEFVKMILVDGSFIVELLLRDYSIQYMDENDDKIYQRWKFGALSDDIMLLENQLPFFVLEELFNLIPVYKLEGNPSFLGLTHEFFKYTLPKNELPNIISSAEVKHFVDFIHCCYQSSIPSVESSMGDQSRGNVNYDYLPTVTELHEAGVKFKKRTSCSLFDIKFSNGILEIPELVIWDRTESLFRNLMAFEHCHWIDKCAINYIFLFDGMVNTSKDVDLLIQKGIIKCRIGSSEDVSILFNNICKHVDLGPPYYFSSLCKDLHAYCRRPWHRWKATLKRDYFNTPWKVVSIIVAVIFLVLTSIQAVCSVISL